MYERVIIILGSSLEQEQMYIEALKLNLCIVSIDKNKNSLCRKYSKYFIQESTSKPDKIIKKIEKLKSRYHLNLKGVITLGTDIPLTVAKIANYFKLRSISLESAKLASNKILMKKRFKKFKVKTANFFFFSSFSNFYNLIKKSKNRFIIKPSDNRGARGVVVVDLEMGKKKLKNLFKKSKNLSTEKKVICEDYINGDQISAEGVFINKKYFGFAFSDRNYDKFNYTKPNIVENGGSVPSRQSGSILKLINKTMVKAARSLNINFGTIKGDIIIKNKKVYIVELAARLSGGYFASMTIPMSYGINIVKISLLCVLNKKIPLKLIRQKFIRYHTQRYIFTKSGKVSSIKINKNILKRKYLKKFEIFIKKNQNLKRVSSHPDRRGMIICSGSNYENSIKNSNFIVNNLKINFRK